MFWKPVFPIYFCEITLFNARNEINKQIKTKPRYSFTVMVMN